MLASVPLLTCGRRLGATNAGFPNRNFRSRFFPRESTTCTFHQQETPRRIGRPQDLTPNVCGDTADIWTGIWGVSTICLYTSAAARKQANPPASLATKESLKTVTDLF